MLDALWAGARPSSPRNRPSNIYVAEALVAAGGRVRLDTLQQILDVDITHVRKKAEEVTREQDADEEIVHNVELVTGWYLDRLAEETGETLREGPTGQVTIGELATSFDLPVEFIRAAIQSRLLSHIGKDAHLSGGTLYTGTFVKRHMARVRGLFLAVSQPTQIDKVVSAHGLDADISATPASAPRPRIIPSTSFSSPLLPSSLHTVILILFNRSSGRCPPCSRGTRRGSRGGRRCPGRA